MRASIKFAASILLLSFALSCGAGDEIHNLGSLCDSCPDDYAPVPYCPAFESCIEVPSCGETLICAPSEQDENNYEEADAGYQECDEDAIATECPPGSLEVASCPDEYLCTRINYCDESLLCLELQDACALEPLCPDEDRGVEDYECLPEDETCYRNFHCSGPISCLRCELLPEECPEDTHPVSAEACDEETRPCQRIETCDETLYCAAPATPTCEESACPGESVPIESCESDNPHCLIIDACNGAISCGAPEPHEECRAIPTCPDDLREVSLPECQTDLDACTIKATCGQLAACLPIPQ